MIEHWFDMIPDEDSRVSNPLLTSIEDLFGIDHYDLAIGKPIKSWNSDSYLQSECPEKDGDAEDVLCEHLGVPTFSARLREALANAKVATQDIQYLPVHVFQSTGEEVEGFAFANVVTRVEALDHEHCEMLDLDESTIDPLTGKPKVTGVWTAALKQNALVGHDVIRLVEFWSPVFVSERFVEVFSKGNFTGVTFHRVPVREEGKGRERT